MMGRLGLLLVTGACGVLAGDVTEGMVHLPGGLVRAGFDETDWDKNENGERPSRQVNVKPFWIDSTPVTNADFKKFVRDTKYQTESERFRWSFVLGYLASEEVKQAETTEKLENAPQWLAVEGAYWRMPEGKGSSIKDREDHPVVHIGFEDAAQYCKWAGKRLPFETEWEYAARGDATGKEYPWGSSPRGKAGEHMMNIWQGKFPEENTKEDGYAGTSPVKAYPPNKVGVYSAVGNVWEWTTTLFSRGNPERQQQPKLVLKGGSFVDSVDGKFNHKARVSIRMGNTPDSGSHNTGFRCAVSGEKGDPQPDKPRGKGGKAGLDQDLVQSIIAEEGVEGLQKYMKDIGMDGSVMTPDQLKEKQDELAEKRKNLEEEL